MPPRRTTVSPYTLVFKSMIYSPDRILYPMKRVDFDPKGKRNCQSRGVSGYVRISWEEALDTVANEIRRVKGDYGGRFHVQPKPDLARSMTLPLDDGKRVQLEIEGKIGQILISELQISHGLLGSADLTTPLLGRCIGLDSVDALTLVAGLERESDIQIDDADLTVELFKSIGTLTE